MHVVRGSIDNDRPSVELASDAAEIAVNSRSYIVIEEWPALLRAEDQVRGENRVRVTHQDIDSTRFAKPCFAPSGLSRSDKTGDPRLAPWAQVLSRLRRLKSRLVAAPRNRLSVYEALQTLRHLKSGSPRGTARAVEAVQRAVR